MCAIEKGNANALDDQPAEARIRARLVEKNLRRRKERGANKETGVNRVRLPTKTPYAAALLNRSLFKGGNVFERHDDAVDVALRTPVRA